MMQKLLMCGLIVMGAAINARAAEEASPARPVSTAVGGAVGATLRMTLPEGFDPRRHMLVSEVEPGMTGYGMTVFHGTVPEPFAVEVISVEMDSTPGKAVVWVRCPDERMQQSGPVHGMSGSPIYLWPRGTKAGSMQIGKGGRLIGAFAFGFEFGKDCYVGVQPIELMLRGAERAKEPNAGETNGAAGGTAVNHDNALSLALAAAERGKWPVSQTWRMKTIAELAGIRQANSQLAGERVANWRGAHDAMALPLGAGNTATAQMLQPLLSGTGISAVSGGSEQTMAATPPQWIDGNQVKPVPGGVLSVPMVSGDADMSVSGTITDIITRNGKEEILAFGHAFTGQGVENLPMATGYVHFVQPSVQSSFKLGGTLKVFGSLVNDEHVGVFGITGANAPLRPAEVTVQWPDASKDRTYHFQLAQHPTYTPMLGAAVIVRCLTSDTEWPDHSTLLIDSTIDFGPKHVLHIRQMMPEPDAQAVASAILPAMSVLSDSQFGKMTLRSMKTTVKVVPKVMASEISNVVIQNTSVKPGGAVNIDVELRPFQGKAYTQRISFPVPADQPEGTYVMFVGGANAYMRMQLQTHPHWTRISNQQELFDIVQYIMNVKSDVMYASLIPQENQSVAVGRTELDKLPSSRAAMLLQPTNSLAMEYQPTLDHQIPMDGVVMGDFAFPLIVEKQPGNVQPKQ